MQKSQEIVRTIRNEKRGLQVFWAPSQQHLYKQTKHIVKNRKGEKREGMRERARYLETNLVKDLAATYGEKCKPSLRVIKENLHQWREMYVLTPGETLAQRHDSAPNEPTRSVQFPVPTVVSTRPFMELDNKSKSR